MSEGSEGEELSDGDEDEDDEDLSDGEFDDGDIDPYRRLEDLSEDDFTDADSEEEEDDFVREVNRMRKIPRNAKNLIKEVEELKK